MMHTVFGEFSDSSPILSLHMLALEPWPVTMLYYDEEGQRRYLHSQVGNRASKTVYRAWLLRKRLENRNLGLFFVITGQECTKERLILGTQQFLSNRLPGMKDGNSAEMAETWRHLLVALLSRKICALQIPPSGSSSFRVAKALGPQKPLLSQERGWPLEMAICSLPVGVFVSTELFSELVFVFFHCSYMLWIDVLNPSCPTHQH